MSSKGVYLNGPMNTFSINCPNRKENNFREQIDVGENNKSKQNIIEQMLKEDITKYRRAKSNHPIS